MLVVTPALNTKLKTLTSDEDRAREQAQERLDASLARLREAGIDARGEVGDGNPLQAMEDALRTFGGQTASSRLTPKAARTGSSGGWSSGARERFAVPITHVVVDLEAESREDVR